jgi:hypothetical protein
VAVLAPVVKNEDEAIPAPKGHEPQDPAAFPLQTKHFQRTAKGAIIAIVDP